MTKNNEHETKKPQALAELQATERFPPSEDRESIEDLSSLDDQGDVEPSRPMRNGSSRETVPSPIPRA